MCESQNQHRKELSQCKFSFLLAFHLQNSDDCSETREVLLETGLIEEHSACLNGGCAAALGKCTSGSDARVSGLKLDDHMLSVEDLLETAKDLLVKALLNLRTSCEVLNDAIELG